MVAEGRDGSPDIVQYLAIYYTGLRTCEHLSDLRLPKKGSHLLLTKNAILWSYSYCSDKREFPPYHCSFISKSLWCVTACNLRVLRLSQRYSWDPYFSGIQRRVTGCRLECDISR